jgi:hypothetical protein
MTDFLDAYADATDSNRQYDLLRDELARLRGRRDDVEYFDEEAVLAAVREANETVDGDLVVFAANDFGRPRAYRPEGLPRVRQDDVRQAILEDKYDASNDDLDAIRRDLREAHPGLHKALVAECRSDVIRYHLPEGSNDSTNFLTVREMVGLVDYTTNSAQRDGLSVTY